MGKDRGSVALRVPSTGYMRHRRRQATLHLHRRAEGEVRLLHRGVTSELVNTGLSTDAEKVNRRSSALGGLREGVGSFNRAAHRVEGKGGGAE